MSVLLILIFLIGYTNSTNSITINQVNGGIAPIQLADNIIKKYDQDKDGVLNVTADSFLRTESETSSGRGTIVLKTESRGLLFTDADEAGNKDGRVTNTELLKFIEKFDENDDGEINLLQNWFAGFFFDSEWEKFDAKYEERYKYETK